MFLPQNSSPASNPPLLSYADRAKKARNIKSPNSVPPPPPRLADYALGTPPSSASNSSTTSSASISTLSQSNSTSTDITPSSSVILTTRSSSPSPPDLNPTLNGHSSDSHYRTPDLTSKALSIVAAHTHSPSSSMHSPQKLRIPAAIPAAPTVNVWSLRKEQMAAAQAQQARNAQPSAPQPQSQLQRSNSHQSNGSNNGNGNRSGGNSSRSSSRAPSSVTAPSSLPSSIIVQTPNILNPDEDPTIDPFVVRMPPPRVLPSTRLSSHSDAKSSRGKSAATEDEVGEIQERDDVQVQAESHNTIIAKTLPPPLPQPQSHPTSGRSSPRHHSQPHPHPHTQPRGRRLDHEHDSTLTGSSGYSYGPGYDPNTGTGLNSRSSGSGASSPHPSYPVHPAAYPSYLNPGPGYSYPLYQGSPYQNPNPNNMYSNTLYGPYIGQPSHNHNNTTIPSNMYINGHSNTVQSQSPATPYPALPPPPPHYSSYSHFPMLPQQQLGGRTGLEPSPPQPEYGSSLANVTSSGDDKDTVTSPQKTRPIPVVFGSISVDTSSPNTTVAPEENDATNREGKDTTSGDARTVFSIGVGPGEELSPSRLRSRTRSSQTRSRMPSGTDTWLMTDLTNGEIPGEQKRSDRNGREAEVQDDDDDVKDNDNDDRDGTARGGVVDLTDPAVQTQAHTKWEFGTASRPAVEADGGTDNLPVSVEPGRMGLDASRPIYIPLTMGLVGPVTDLGIPLTPSIIPGGGVPANGTAPSNSNEFEVQNFGFGFGVVRGGAYPSVMTRDQRREQLGGRDQEVLSERQMGSERERQRDSEFETARETQRLRDLEFNSGPNRSKRGSYGGSGYERGDGFDRGGFGGRRGRGYGRGGFRGYRGGGYQALQRPPPPQSFQPLAPLPPSETVYYPPSPLTTYIPTGYESYQPPPPPLPPQSIPVTPAAAPVPVPLSTLSFPLDPTRYYLLGQLEYYLSPQNMAQDFFLRQRMDHKGWIPISLIASFNRVRQLTMDIQLVRDVLILSNMVQVKDESVRMGGWEQFVLPNAAPSTVEEDDHTHASPTQAESEADEDVDEEDEEEVVFVMDRSEPWSPERRVQVQ